MRFLKDRDPWHDDLVLGVGLVRGGRLQLGIHVNGGGDDGIRIARLLEMALGHFAQLLLMLMSVLLLLMGTGECC